MTVRDPFEGFHRDLDHESVSTETVRIELPQGVDDPGDDAQARFVLYTGALDLLAEAVCEQLCATDEERVERLSTVLRLAESVEPVLRFALFERSSRAERQELVARMRGKDIALTEGWMIPRLHDDIVAYRSRIESLQRAVEARRT